MPRPLSQSVLPLVVLVLSIAAGSAADDRAVFRDALAAMQRGDFRAAEHRARDQFGRVRGNPLFAEVASEFPSPFPQCRREFQLLCADAPRPELVRLRPACHRR